MCTRIRSHMVAAPTSSPADIHRKDYFNLKVSLRLAVSRKHVIMTSVAFVSPVATIDAPSVLYKTCMTQ